MVDPQVTVILPAYNEADALPRVLADLMCFVDSTYEIIVVDDGSTDATAAVAEQYACRLIRHPVNKGKGAAVQTGIAQARGQCVIVMDADATYPAVAVPQIAALLRNHDLVRCRRRGADNHMPPINRLGNWLFDRLLALAHGLEGADHLSGMYGLRREALMRLDLEATGFDLEAEIGIKARVRGLRTAVFPIDYQPRVGVKKLRPWRDGFAILCRVIVLFLLYNPARMFILPGVALMGFTLAGAIMLAQGPVVTPYFGLSIHSFIVTTLGVLAGFQLIVFGLAAALYGVEAGRQAPRWLVYVSSPAVRLGGVGLGLVMALAAAFRIIQLTIRWLAAGAGLFFETLGVVLASTVLVLGLQILSAALFLSIFSGRLGRHSSLQGEGGRYVA